MSNETITVTNVPEPLPVYGVCYYDPATGQLMEQCFTGLESEAIGGALKFAQGLADESRVSFIRERFPQALTLNYDPAMVTWVPGRNATAGGMPLGSGRGYTTSP